MSYPHQYNLLVVDDNECSRESIRSIFGNEYNIYLADSGEKALEIASGSPIDLAIVDIRMPGVSGLETLHGLKEIDRSTEVIVLTAHETLETARQALRLGARDYLGKPFDVATLRRSVANAALHRKVSRNMTDAEKELKRISSELADTMTKAEMASTINEVYAGVLHDINNPLTIVDCFLDLLMDRLSQGDQMDEAQIEQIREQLATIARQIKLCSEISSRHLDFLKRPSASACTSVNIILRDLGDLIRIHPIVRSSDIKVNLLDPDAIVGVSGAELTEILLNLMINAIQGSPESQQVDVDAKLIDRPLDIAVMKNRGSSLFLHEEHFKNHPPFVSIAVKDNAGGIAPHLLENIFEPYFSTKPRGKGTGIGLATISRLLKKCWGGLHVETTIGSGSCFTVFLPLADPSVARTNPPEELKENTPM